MKEKKPIKERRRKKRRESKEKRKKANNSVKRKKGKRLAIELRYILSTTNYSEAVFMSNIHDNYIIIIGPLYQGLEKIIVQPLGEF